MRRLVHEKETAIALRKKGYSYKEILEKVPVAKSSLSLWLKDLPLTKNEKSLLRKRTDNNISKGRIKAAASLHDRRIKRESEWLQEAKYLFSQYKTDQLFHTGIALYWAEGAKRNDMVHFMNSDVEMIRVMLLWIERYTDYNISDLGFRLYLHDPYKHENWEKWWEKHLGVAPEQFKKTIVKPTQLGIKKRPNYKGCLRVEVPKSTKLLMIIKFWMNMLVEFYQKG